MRKLALTLLLATLPATAQTAHHKVRADKETLRFTLILSRHGIRPPLRPNSALADYSSQPWPAWEVGLGQLTPHGVEALHSLGAYMRADYAAKGLLPAAGCDQSALFLYADTDQRDLATDRALNEGMFPHCPQIPVFAVAPGTKDPLFNREWQPAQEPKAAYVSYRQHFPDLNVIARRFGPTLTSFAHILAPDPAHPAKLSFLDAQPAIVQGLAAPGVAGGSIRGPVFSATTLAEDIFLEYVNNKPMSDVGWGRVDLPTLQKLRALHAFAFRASYGDGYVGNAENSSLLSHFLDALQWASVENAPFSTLELLGEGPLDLSLSLAPKNKKLVIVAGHDDNLVAFGGMLGLHWHADGIDDETPPGSQIILELWQTGTSRPAKQFVRLSFLAASAADQRAATPLTRKHPPIIVPLKLPTCAEACPIGDFLRIARSGLNRHFLHPALAPAIGQEPPPPSPPAKD